MTAWTWNPLQAAIADALRSGRQESDGIDRLLLELYERLRNGESIAAYGPILGFRSISSPTIARWAIAIVWHSKREFVLRGRPPGRTGNWEFARIDRFGDVLVWHLHTVGELRHAQDQ